MTRRPLSPPLIEPNYKGAWIPYMKSEKPYEEDYTNSEWKVVKKDYSYSTELDSWLSSIFCSKGNVLRMEALKRINTESLKTNVKNN